MAIVPAGKMRLMFAQNINNPLYETPDPGESFTPPEETPEEDLSYDQELNRLKNRDFVEEEETQNNTLSDYVFKKLQEFGYPPRRLEEFKKEFVSQDVSADGTENVEIKIPDKYYPNPTTGETKTIETSDLKKIVLEIKNNFGLNFNGAHRSEGRWTIDFTSSEVSTQEDEEEQGFNDNLEDVYGNPAAKNKKKKRISKASTIEEMIIKNKNAIVEKLKKLLNLKK